MFLVFFCKPVQNMYELLVCIFSYGKVSNRILARQYSQDYGIPYEKPAL